MASFKYDVFFAGKEGFSEHISIEADTYEEIKVARGEAVSDLQDSGASPRPSDQAGGGGSRFARPTLSVVSPMEKAGAEILGGAVVAQCPNGCGPMRQVRGGVSKKTGKPYNSFFACDSCGGKGN